MIGGAVMASEDIALMAHLMRRAGFGASREELEVRAARGYEATVEELLQPTAEPVDRYEFLRYLPAFWKPVTSPGMGMAAWFHTMLNTQRLLEEKMVLFWHHIFATGRKFKRYFYSGVSGSPTPEPPPPGRSMESLSRFLRRHICSL